MNFDTLKKLRALSDEQMIEIALQLAVRYPATFKELSTDTVSEFDIYRDDGSGEQLGRVTLRASEIAQIRGAGVSKHGYVSGKIGAIKKVREITGLGLLEAKLLVEAQGWYGAASRSTVS